MGVVRAERRPPHGRTRVTVKRMLQSRGRAGGCGLWAQKVVGLNLSSFTCLPCELGQVT